MASISDLFTQATTSTRPSPTTLTAIKGIGAANLTAAALTGWPTATAVHFIIYQVTTGGAKIAGTQTDWKGIVSGSTITNLTLKAGTDAAYPIGSIVEASPTAAYANDISAGMTAQHSQLGAHVGINNTGGLTNAGGLTTDTITASGSGTLSTKILLNPYKFRAHNTSNQGITSSTWTTAVLGTKNFDTGSNFASSIFTAPVAGFYQFNGSIDLTGTVGTLTGVGIRFWVNNSSGYGPNFNYDNNVSYDNMSETYSDLIQLGAGDTIALQGWGVATSAAFTVGTSFSGFLVSTT
jgi:hypothetical protein